MISSNDPGGEQQQYGAPGASQTTSQQQQQQQPQQQQSQQQQAAPPPQLDVEAVIHQKAKIILDFKERAEVRLKAMEGLKDLFDDIIIKDKTIVMTQVSAQIFYSIMTHVTPVHINSSINFKLRKMALEFYHRFTPQDGYKIHNKQIEDLFYCAILEENEPTGLLMMKYLTDLLKAQRLMNPAGVSNLLSSLRESIERISADFESNPDRFFGKFNFTPENMKDEGHMSSIIEMAHFEVPVRVQKCPPHILYPKLKNSVKVIAEFMAMENVYFHFYKERALDDIKNSVTILQRFCKLDIRNVSHIEPDYLTTFQEAQYRCFYYFYAYMRPKDVRDPMNLEALAFVRSYAHDIALGLRNLLNHMGCASASFRKEYLTLIKTMFQTDIRTELFDILIELCYEETLVGSPSLMSSSYRSDLYMLKADLLHSARQHIDWSTFQLLMTFAIRDCLDYTLTPGIQAVYGKLILNFIDACQKAKDSKFPQLSAGFTHDSAKSAYESVFHMITKKIHIVTQRGVKAILRKTNRNVPKPAQAEDEIEDEVEAENGSDASEDHSDVEERVEESSGSEDDDSSESITLEDEPTEIDEFEDESSDEDEEDTDVQSILFRKMLVEGLNHCADDMIRQATTGVAIDTDGETIQEGRDTFQVQEPELPDDFEGLFSELNKKIVQNRGLLELSSVPMHDVRLNMVWRDRDLGHKTDWCLFDTEPPVNDEVTFFPPDTLPFNLTDTKLLIKNYSIALKMLMYALQQYGGFQSVDLSINHLAILNRLFHDYLLVMELSYFSDEESQTRQQYQSPPSSDDKDIIDCFLQIFASIHPAIFEQILKNHMTYIQRRCTLSLPVFSVFCTMMTNQYLMPCVCTVYLEYLMDNVDLMFILDEEDNIKNCNGWTKVFKFLLSYLMSAITTEPHTLNFIPKLQAFMLEFVAKGLKAILRTGDQNVSSLSFNGNSTAFHLIKMLLRHCGMAQGDALYRAFVPLFPSFLQWLSSAQNMLSTETCHDLFIEMCLSLPARLSSLIPFMPLLIDATINSAQNFSLFNAQGLRTIELCLDNYTVPQLKEFFGNLFPRLHDQLWNVCWAIDTQIASIAVRLMGKLSAMNRSSLFDVQRLTVNEKPHDKFVEFVIKFERSGKQADAVIRENMQLAEEAPTDTQNQEWDISEDIKTMFSFEEELPSAKPIVARFSLQNIVPLCFSVVRNMVTSETNIQKAFFAQGRAESACICLSVIKSIFDANNLKFASRNDFTISMVYLNDFIIKESEKRLNCFSAKLPIELVKNEKDSTRTTFVDALAGLILANSAADLQEDFFHDFEVIVDNLTLQLHLETGSNSFRKPSSQVVLGHAIDAGILVDAICKILVDPFVRLQGAGCITLLRMIQTAKSFATTPEKALNIPLFTHVTRKLAELCRSPVFVDRLGGIAGLEVLVENLPFNFLLSNFPVLFHACADVLQFGDDDISFMSQETTQKVVKPLIDAALSPLASDQTRTEAVKFLGDFVMQHNQSASIWTAEMIADILSILKVQKDVPLRELFPEDQVAKYFARHQQEFIISSLEYKLVQLKVFNAFMSCVSYQDVFTETTKRYLPSLFYSYVYTDEELVTCPNYEKVPLVNALGATIVPSSVCLKRDNGVMFLSRLKEYRKIASDTMTMFCLNLMSFHGAENIQVDAAYDGSEMIVGEPTNATEAVDMIIAMHLFVARMFGDARQDYSIESLSLILKKYKHELPRLEWILEIVNDLKVGEMKNLKLIDVLVNSEKDIWSTTLDYLMTVEGDYEPILYHIPQVTDNEDEYLKLLAAFLNIFQKGNYLLQEKFLLSVLNLTCQQEMLHYFEVDSFDIYGPIARFFGSQRVELVGHYVFSFFLNHEALSSAIKREAFVRLMTHTDAYLLRSLLNRHEMLLCSILNEHALDCEPEKLAFKIVDHGPLDELVLKVLTAYVDQHENHFARDDAIASQLKYFFLSNYFRGNYGFVEHGLDNTNRVKVTTFNEWKASVPEMAQALLIKFFLKNPYRFDMLLTICTSLQQNYFSDNVSVRKLISTFVIPRTSLHWKRQMLIFAINKTSEILNAKVDPADAMAVSRFKDAQVYLGYFFLFVVHPCFSRALDLYPSNMVFNGSRDGYMTKDVWTKDMLKNVEAPDLVKVFCEDVLDKMNKIPETRPELVHGLILFSGLLMQRAASHIHPPGSKQQSKHLQICMLIAWPSLTGNGMFADKGLRTVAQFFLATVMTAVYIKKDIVYQHFDSLMGTSDNRDNPLVQKALDTVTYHVAFGRKDDCMGGFTERIKDYMNSDGLNFTKVANVLHMLARNYRNFFAYRSGLVPSIIYALTRVNMLRYQLSLQLSIDGLEAVIGWEEMLSDKIEDMERALEREDLDAEAKMDKKNRLLQSPEFANLAPVLVDSLALVICKAAMQSLQEKDERSKKVLNLFQRALCPNVFCRPICIRLERMLQMPKKELQTDTPQYINHYNQGANLAKILTQIFSNMPPEAVFQCGLYLQNSFRNCLLLKHKNLFESVLLLIVKIVEISKDFLHNERRFQSVFLALDECFTGITDQFINRANWAEVLFMVPAMRSICVVNDSAYRNLCGPSFILMLSHIVKNCKLYPPSNPAEQNNLPNFDKRASDVMAIAMDIFTQKASVTAPEVMKLYLHNVIHVMLTRNDILQPKLLEFTCRTLEDSLKMGIERVHISIIGSLTRHHMNAIMKSLTTLIAYFNAVALVCEDKSIFEREFIELYIPFYLGLSNNNDYNVRSRFLNMFDSKLPRNAYERLCTLLAFESWQMVGGSAIIPTMVEMMLRCCKGLDYNVYFKSFFRPEAIEEIEPLVEPEVVELEDQVTTSPTCSLLYTMHDFVTAVGKDSSNVEEFRKIVPEPGESGVFNNCGIECEPLQLTTLLSNYHDFMESCEDVVRSDFPEFLMGISSLVLHEGDMAGKVFVDLFTSMWASFTDLERTVVTELMGHFMQMPIFASTAPQLVRPFWQAIMQCKPTMDVDKFKMSSNPCGPRHAHYVIAMAENEFRRSCNLAGAVSDLKCFYQSVNEFDMYTYAWKLHEVTPNAWKAHFLYNQSRFKLSFETALVCQQDYVTQFPDREQVVDDENVGLKINFDNIVELAVTSMKQMNRWSYVAKHAEKVHDISLCVEALFHTANNFEDWNEVDHLLNVIGTVEDLTASFRVLVYRLCYLIARSDARAFSEENYQEKLTAIVLERMRRLPTYFVPTYLEVFRDCALLIELLDYINVVKEMARSAIPIAIDTVIKSAVMSWRYRTVCRTDSPVEGLSLLRVRYVLMWMINNRIVATSPELRNPGHGGYTLTPMHNVVDNALQIARHFSHFKLFNEAKQEIATLKNTEVLNPHDICTATCELARCTMKQCQFQPGTIGNEQLARELDAFCQLNVDYFKPDMLAFYSATRGEVFEFLGDANMAQDCFRIALKLENSFDKTLFQPLSLPVLKKASKFLYNRNCIDWKEDKTVYSVSLILEMLTKMKPNESVKSISKLMWIMKRINAGGMHVAQLNKAVIQYAPKISPLSFLPFIQPIVTEIANVSSKACGILLTVLHQSFPMHAAYAILLEIGSEAFHATIQKMKRLYSFEADLERISVDVAFDSSPDHPKVFYTFKNVNIDANQIEHLTVTSPAYQEMLKRDTRSFKTGNEMLIYILSKICRNVPSEIAAFDELVRGFEEMKSTTAVSMLKNLYKLSELYFNNDSKFMDLVAVIKAILQGGQIIPLLKPIFDKVERMCDDLVETREFFEDSMFVDAVKDLEGYVNQYESKIPLFEVSPILSQFTGQRAHLPSLSSYFDPQFVRCMPFIEVFLPTVRTIASNGKVYQLLDVKLSNGKILTYYVDDTNVDDYFMSPFKVLVHLNMVLDKCYDTNRRGALFRIPTVFQLEKVRLTEVCETNLNKFSYFENLTTPFTHLVTESEGKGSKLSHQFDQIAVFHELSKAVGKEEAAKQVESRSDLTAMERYMSGRFDDAAAAWYVRKQIAVQLALQSVVEYGLELCPMEYKDLIFDHVYGRIWNMKPTFEKVHVNTIADNVLQRKVPFRMTPMLVNYLSFSVEGHFAATFTAAATSLSNKKFATYLRPFYFDMYQRVKCRSDGRRMAVSDIAIIEEDILHFEEKFKFVAENPDTAVFTLLEEAKNVSNRVEGLRPSQLPWL